ncbi:MAG: PAS domain-containing protein [Candidatus Lloydbacteria bacterium]|nr:PAS domain-containing protein [Candidatus Lloydbacteria bacterium]
MEHLPQKLFKANVSSVEVAAEGVKKITFKISEPFSFFAGQYVWVEIPELKVKDIRGSRRAFSICSVPNNENNISIVARISESGYKQSLFALDPGDEVTIHGPFGSAFTLHDRRPPIKHLIMVAGGVGVASFLATIETIKKESLPVKVFLAYFNTKEETTPFLNELEELKKNTTFFDYVVAYDFFSWSDVKDAYARFGADTEWWISGPQAMVDHVYGILEKNGISLPDMVFENYYPTRTNSLTFEKIREQLEKEGLFAQIIQNSSNHTIITDVNGVILFANKAVELATGYLQEEVIGNTPRLWGGLMSPEFYRDFWSRKQSEPFFETEIVNRHKSGKLYYSTAYITQIFNNAKELIGYIGMEKDISKRVEMEERILLQYDLISKLSAGVFGPALLDKTVEMIASGLHWDFGAMWVPSEDGSRLHNVYTWSRKPEKYGAFEKRTKSEVFGKGTGLPGRVYQSRVSEWIPDVVRDKNFPRADSAKEVGLHTGFAFPVYEGEHIYAIFEFFSEEVTPEDDYLLKTYYLIGNQIGEHFLRHTQEAELKSLLERFDLATKAAHIGVWEWNLEKNELYWDDNMYHLFGVDKKDIGKEVPLIDVRKRAMHPEDFEKVEQERMEAIRGIKSFDTTFRVLWKDESVHYLRAFGVVEKDTDGKPVRMIGVNWDVTKEKETDRVKSEFVSLASHQLRTPLTGIEWTAELFSKKEKLTETGKKYLNDIFFSAKRLSTLVRLLLDVSRIEGGNVNVSPEPLDLVSFTKETLENMHMLCEKRGLDCFLAKESPERCAVTTDKNMLGYVMQNIIANAIEYTNTRGKVSVALEEKSDGVLIKVQDTGIGIPKKEQGRIFEKFFRASNAVTAKPDGSGLGLYIVSGAVKLLGGKIRFESEEGKGTTFFIELPLVSQAHIGEKELVQMED